MGCFRGTMVVTFDEVTYELFNPAALRLYSSKDTRGRSLVKSPGIFDIQKGTKVRVHPHLRDVMLKQSGHGEWSYKMTKFLGKEGIVADNIPGGDVIVNFTAFESYRMGRNTLEIVQRRNRKKSGNKQPIDLKPFAMGDILRLNIPPEDLLSNLQLLRIPLEFLVIAGNCGLFVGYVNENRVVVDFGDGVHFVFDIQLLTKAVSSETEEFEKLRKQDNDLKVGSKVMLWIGPMNFVKKCLTTFKEGFEKALGEEATIVGYDDVGNTVIEYEDGNMYLLPDEYLCSRRQVWMSKDIMCLKWDQNPIEAPRNVSALEATILHSITEVLKANRENSAIGWNSVMTKMKDECNHTEMKITFPGPIGDHERFIQRMQSKLATEDVRADYANQSLTIRSPGIAYVMRFEFSSEIETVKSEDKTPPPQEEEKEERKEVEERPCEGIHSASLPQQQQEAHEEVEESPNKATPALERTSSVTDPVQDEENAASILPQDGRIIAIPEGVTQVVLQIGKSTPSQSAQVPTRPSHQPLDAMQGSGIVVNPQNATIHMYGDGGNQLNIQNSQISRVQAE